MIAIDVIKEIAPLQAAGNRGSETPLGSGGAAPVVPLFISGITDSRYFRARGIPAYGLSPFELEGEYTKTVHGPDERIAVAAFEKGVATMKRIVRRLVSPEADAR